MEFTELVKERYSVRAYKNTPVEKEKLDRILETACLAPTAKNSQSFKLFIIDVKNNQGKLLKIYSRDWFVQAPIVVLICGIPKDNWVRADGKNYNDIDAAIVMDHLILAATDAGLGTCWVGAFDSKAAKELLALPQNFEPIAFTPLGYPADNCREKNRKKISEIVEYLN
jgi:nitroreductase